MERRPDRAPRRPRRPRHQRGGRPRPGSRCSCGLDKAVTVVVGDGAQGHRDSAPYDRVIATYAVDHVPWTWVERLRPGGDLGFPWGRLGHFAVTVGADGRSVTGWLQGLAQFMPACGTAPSRSSTRSAPAAPQTTNAFSPATWHRCTPTATCCGRCASRCPTS
ncbi:hypothetical protein [Embleya sp. NPDC020886]|uniref:hypothetical protein n=1 Tax=Embleya sp. NPDC020886 TaxID=3363980 RepID=UPI0037A8C78E